MGTKELEKLLKRYDIPYKEWGKGRAKSFDDLLKEVQDNETMLVEENGELIRYLHVVGITVTCGNQVLIEECQVFDDGRRRERNLSVSCAEKMIFGELPKEAAVRCLKEELGIQVHESELIPKIQYKDESDSYSYPGLKTIYYRNPFDYEMKPELYKTMGYIEDQGNKKTIFKWKSKNQI